MTDRKTDKPARPESQEERQAELAPETHNDEQDDHRSQAQQVSEDAQARGADAGGAPTESRKGPNASGVMGDSTQDTVDHMRDMESSGRVDMDAYKGEPNHDDNVDKFGKDKKPDGLRGDGT